MRFKKIFSCILVASLINSNFINAMPGRRILSLEERERIGSDKLEKLRAKIVEVTGAKSEDDPTKKDILFPVKMTGPFMGNFLITQEMARNLLSIDTYGDVIKGNLQGTSIVKELGNVFFKTDGRHFNPEQPMLAPAMENAAYWFYHIIFGEGATPSTLITLNNVHIQRPPTTIPKQHDPTNYKALSELNDFYKICRENRNGFSHFKEESIKKNTPLPLLKQFIGFFNPTFENFIVQASEGVEGEDLGDFIKRVKTDPKIFDTLSTKSLSIHFLTSLLLNLSDAKGDNFKVYNNRDNTLEIIGIDNDRFLAPDIFQQCPHPEHYSRNGHAECPEPLYRPGVRSVFYAWRNVRNMSLDRDIKSLLLNTNFSIAIYTWLKRMSVYDIEYKILRGHGFLGTEFFKKQDLDKIDLGTQVFINAGLIMHSSTFPLNLYKNFINEIMGKFTALNNFFINHLEDDIRHKDIIKDIQYYINLFYAKALKEQNNISDLNNSLDNPSPIISSNTLGKAVIDNRFLSYASLRLELPPDIINKVGSPRIIVSIKKSILELKALNARPATNTIAIDNQQHNGAISSPTDTVQNLADVAGHSYNGNSPLSSALALPSTLSPNTAQTPDDARIVARLKVILKSPPLLFAILVIPMAFLYRYYTNVNTEDKFDTPIIDNESIGDKLDKPVSEILINNVEPTFTKDTKDKSVEDKIIKDPLDSPTPDKNPTDEINKSVDYKELPTPDKEMKEETGESTNELNTPIDFTAMRESWNKISANCAKFILSRSNLTDLYPNSNSIQDQENKFFSSIANLKILDLSNKQNTNLCKIGNNELEFISYLSKLTSINLSGEYFNKGGITDDRAKTLTTLTNLTSLDLRSNQIGDEGAKALSSLTNLNSLNLWNNEIGAEGAEALTTLINLTSLELHNNQIGGEGAKALSSLTNLTSLDLSYNQIGDEGVKAISTLTNLTFLNLYGNQVEEEGAMLLTSLTNLTLLDLSENKAADIRFIYSLTNLTSLKLRCFAKQPDCQLNFYYYSDFSSLPNLTYLDISGNKIAIGRPLSTLINLTSLDLSYTYIPPEEVAYISPLINLTTLNLWDNQISEKGAKFLTSLTNLAALDLGSNAIGDEGTKFLSSLINLTSLNLCCANQLGDKGITALSSLTNLISLRLEENRKIGAEGVKSLSSLSNLTSLDLSWNQIGHVGAKSLSSLTNLTNLNLWNNQIGDEGAKYLLHLTNLTYLNLVLNPIGEEMKNKLREMKINDLKL